MSRSAAARNTKRMPSKLRQSPRTPRTSLVILYQARHMRGSLIPLSIQGAALTGHVCYKVQMKKYELTQLGQKTTIATSPNEAVIETVPNPHSNSDYVI